MNDITRSMEATSGATAAFAERRRKASPSGIWGMWLLIATETALFGTVLSSYFYLRFTTVQWPPPGIEAPTIALPALLTGIVVSTSVPMFLAARSARRGRARAAWAWLAPAFVVQIGYLAGQIVLYADDLSKFSPRENAYGSIYFTMLALDHAHVLIGILLVGFLLVRLVWGLTNYRVIAVRAVGMYWHFVNAMTVLVLLTQLSPSL